MSSITIDTKGTNALVKQGTLSQTAATFLATQPRDIEVPDLSGVYGDPVFSCFLIDESGSMNPYKQSVIDDQSDVIQALRGSAECKNGTLFITQCLFSDSARVLHPLTKLSPSGTDEVILFNSGDHYKPNGCTALYQSLFYLLQDMTANIANALNSGLKCSFEIGVITDGKDTEGGIQPAEISTVIQELQSHHIIRNSVIVGLTDPEFTIAMLDDLKSKLGFQTAISLSKADPREIRRAFIHGSPLASAFLAKH